MQYNRSVPFVGLVVCLVFLTVLFLPFLFVDTLAINMYYTTGGLGIYGAGAIVLFVLISFFLELFSRWDISTIAGAILGFSLILVLFTSIWAVDVPPEIIMSLSTLDELAYHRWVLVALATMIAVVGVWNVRGSL